MADKKGSSSEKLLYCSFCGKSQHEVKKLIAGPSVFICDECIDLCNEIIRDELPSGDEHVRHERRAKSASNRGRPANRTREPANLIQVAQRLASEAEILRSTA